MPKAAYATGPVNFATPNARAVRAGTKAGEPERSGSISDLKPILKENRGMPVFAGRFAAVLPLIASPAAPKSGDVLSAARQPAGEAEVIYIPPVNTVISAPEAVIDELLLG